MVKNLKIDDESHAISALFDFGKNKMAAKKMAANAEQRWNWRRIFAIFKMWKWFFRDFLKLRWWKLIWAGQKFKYYIGISKNLTLGSPDM